MMLKSVFPQTLTCIGSFEIIKKIIYDNMDLLPDKNKASQILQEIAELVHPGIQSMLEESASDESISSMSDERKCLSVILELQVKLSKGYAEQRIAELIKTMAEMVVIDDSDDAQKTLKKHGIKVVQGGFLIANKHIELSKKLKNTPWESNWSHILIRLPGAHKKETVNFSDCYSRAVMLPFSYIH